MKSFKQSERELKESLRKRLEDGETRAELAASLGLPMDEVPWEQITSAEAD